MQRLIDKFVDNFLKDEGENNEEELEIYKYGLLVGSEFFVFLFCFLIICLFNRMLAEGIIFLTIFMLIRSYTGGLHLDRYRDCMILSCSVLVLVLMAIKYLSVPIYILFSAAVVLSVITLKLGKGNKEADSEQEESFFNHKTKVNLAGIMLVAIIFCFADYVNGMAAITYTMVCIVISLYCGKMKKKLENE